MTTMEQVRRSANPAFRYVVSIGSQPIAAFTECTLPTIEWEMLPVEEGGLNTYVHQLPGRRKQATVSLKNGVGLGNLLMDWYLDAMMESFQNARKSITISFYDGPSQALMEWQIEDCIPIKWVGPQLKSDNNAIAIQTLDLACGEIQVAAVSRVSRPPAEEPSPWVPRSPRVTNAPS